MPSLSSVILEMLMMRGTDWTEETLMEAVSLLSLPEGHLVVPGSFPRAEALLQGVVVASTVVLKVTGLEIALLVTGRTNVIVVEIGVTSRGTARTVLRSSGGTQVTQDRRLGLGLGLLVAEEEAPAEAIAATVATAAPGHRLGRKRIIVLKLQEAEALKLQGAEAPKLQGAEALNQWRTTLLHPKIGSEV